MKRERIIKKYGSIVGNEKMLFHATSFQNLEKINADGLNRIYAGTHGKIGAVPGPRTFMKQFIYCTFVVISLRFLHQIIDNQTNAWTENTS